jgi:hypothetical protein
VINIGKWRWPIIICLPLIAGGVLVYSGLVRPVFEGEVFLTKVQDRATKYTIHTQGAWPTDTVLKLQSTAQNFVNQSFVIQKKDLESARGIDQKQITDLGAKMDGLMQQQKTILAGPRRNSPRAQLVAKIADLKARRSLLIENYPSHTDIPILAKKIRELKMQMAMPTGPAAGKINDLDRRINEAKVRRDFYARRLKAADKDLGSLKPAWKIIQPIKKPKWPHKVQNWPLAAGVMVGCFILSLLLTQKDRRSQAFDDGLGNSETALDHPVEEPVALEVVHSDLPAAPLAAKARGLYAKWVELAKLLYTPAPEPPQGVLDQVAPLLQESSEFLPEGHDVLARYLARSVTPGDLASHVARTVLMTLTGAEEAGVSPEHRLAMALAALFHDLAVVPRPTPAQDEVGSEVGRLSAAVLPRIPGLPDALLAMVEDILIGMDEFKLDTWQNVANGKNLEPLSKVLREIDRFEKLMQKQRARLDRRIANQ